jgi:hypothetical protein
MSLEADVKEIYRKTYFAKRDLIAKVKTLPENPRTKKLAKNCFIMSSKDLGECWAAEYHNFNSQYEVVIEIINTSELRVILKALGNIIKDGKVKHKNNVVHFHPDVREHLKGIL